MPTAALISGGLGAAGAIGSGVLGYFGSQNASRAQQGFQQQAQDRLYSTLGPILSQGRSIADTANAPLSRLLTPGPGQTETLSQMPGFQFAQDWGQRATRNQGTTLGLGGNTLTAGANFATGLAQQGYGNIVSQLQNYLNSGLNIESGVGTALGGGASRISENMGTTAGAGIMGGTNALSGGLTGATNAGGNALLMNALFSRFGSGSGSSPSGIYGDLSSRSGGMQGTLP